jgi:aspartate/methionine/tyrosine aminotransferase
MLPDTVAPARDFQRLNPNVAAMSPSATLAVSSRAKALKRQGRDVVELSAGEPDFDTPAPVVEAAHQALRDGFFHYTPNAGLPELREAVAEKLRRENGLDIAPDAVLCCSGAKQAIAQAILATCGPGDEVLIPAPYWVSYPDQVILSGATPVVVEASAEEAYTLTPERVEAAITDRTRMLLFNSPSNPTGAVYTPAEIEAFAEMLRGHPDVLVLSDEIYEHVIFDTRHASIGALDGMAHRTLTVNGFSKSFAMTGWRLGYLAGPRWVVDAAAMIQSQLTSAPNAIAQRAGVAALAMSHDALRVMVEAFRRRRDYLIGRLAGVDGIVCPTPEGAFYLFPDFSAFFGRKAPDGTRIDDADALCLYLLERHDLALVPGGAFGAPGAVRISYAAGMDELAKGADRLLAGLAELA